MDECVRRTRSSRGRGRAAGPNETAANIGGRCHLALSYEPQPDGTVHVQQGSRRLGVIEWDGEEWTYRSTVRADRRHRYSALDLTSLQQKLLSLPLPQPPR